MKRLVLLVALITTTAAAQEIEVGMRHLIVTTGSTDDLDLPTSRGFAATFELFVTPRLSTELSIGFANPEATYRDIDVGTLGLQTTAVTARWNFAPDARLSAFAGGGVALVKIGNLDDQLGDDIEVEFDREIAFVVEAGVRFRLRRAPRLATILSVSYIPLTAQPDVAFPELSLDPMTVGVGASWRF